MARSMSTAPATVSVSTPLTARLEAQKAAFYAPQKSDPMEGFTYIAILGGTMLLCMAPGIAYALTPASHGDDH